MQLPYKPNAVRRGVNRHPTPCPAWFARGLTAGRLSLDERFPRPPRRRRIQGVAREDPGRRSERARPRAGTDAWDLRI